jgi:hypothetical protein
MAQCLSSKRELPLDSLPLLGNAPPSKSKACSMIDSGIDRLSVSALRRANNVAWARKKVRPSIKIESIIVAQ